MKTASLASSTEKPTAARLVGLPAKPQKPDKPSKPAAKPASAGPASAGARSHASSRRVVLPNGQVESRYRRPQGAIMLRNWVSVPSSQDEIDLRTTVPKLRHAPDWRKSPEDLIWGVYGSRDIPTAAELMTAELDNQQAFLWEVALHYKLPGVALANGRVDEAAARASEMLPIARLNPAYREVLNALVLKRLQARIDEGLIKLTAPWEKIVALSFERLLIMCPFLVWDLLDELPFVQAVLHSAAIEIGSQTHVLHIATVRANPDRVLQATVRQHRTCSLYLDVPP